MTYDGVAMKKCSHPGCEAEHKAHSWGYIKANDAGWFHQKTGEAWCPEHNPPWVAAWRAQKKQGS